MRFFIVALVLLLVSVIASLFLIEDTGYALFQYGGWRIETSLSLFAVLSVLTYFVISFLVRIVSGFLNGPKSIRLWGKRRSKVKSQKELMKGLFLLIDSNWSRSEKLLSQHAEGSDLAVIHYLAAALAAHQQHSIEFRDHYLRLATASMPDADLAVGLAQSWFLIQDNNEESAQRRLEQLHADYPKDAMVLSLQSQLYQRQFAWEKLEALLPALKKRKVLSVDGLDHLYQRVYLGLMERVENNTQPDELYSVWKRLPKVYKKNEVLLLRYALLLQNLGRENEAERVIENRLREQWSERLINAYAQVESKDAVAQLSLAEGFLSGHDKNPILLMGLGRLAIRCQLWGKARSYLEASLGIMPSLEVYQILATLMEQLGEEELSHQYYREGLALACDIGAQCASSMQS
ncbi:MAG: hypothetical protein GXP22_10195 [Gammaproteobacteria bacterium]|nr:hypothetical protein [Gammaproteobacteria bacterium]